MPQFIELTPDVATGRRRNHLPDVQFRRQRGIQCDLEARDDTQVGCRDPSPSTGPHACTAWRRTCAACNVDMPIVRVEVIDALTLLQPSIRKSREDGRFKRQGAAAPPQVVQHPSVLEIREHAEGPQERALPVEYGYRFARRIANL